MHFNFNTKYYFINNFDTNILNKQDKHTIIIYRDYNSRTINKTLILKLKQYCNQKKLKFFLSNNIKLALKLKLDGAYIPSFNSNFNHLSFVFNKKFEIIGSAHDLKQIRTKERQGVNKIFLSSLFKKNKNYLGINKFKKLSNLTKKKVVVLGGISKKNIRKINLLNIFGFAGISYFE